MPATPRDTPDGYRPAGLGPRAAARLVDGVVVGVPTVYAYVTLGKSMGVPGQFLGAVVLGVAFFLYHVVMEAQGGQTLGKKLLKIQVVAPHAPTAARTYLPPTAAEAARRNWFCLLLVPAALPAWIIALIASFAYLGTVASIAVSIASDPVRQGTHDGVAGGIAVVKL